jgi:hypothetical protein
VVNLSARATNVLDAFCRSAAFHKIARLQLAPNEAFDERRHEMISSHEVCHDVGEQQECGEMADEWKDKRTGDLHAGGLCLSRLPYGYYTFMRIVVCGIAGLIAFAGIRDRPVVQAWSVLLALIAVLFNLLVPVHLDRQTWFYLDLGAAAVFVAHLIFVRWCPTPPRSDP